MKASDGDLVISVNEWRDVVEQAHKTAGQRAGDWLMLTTKGEGNKPLNTLLLGRPGLCYVHSSDNSPTAPAHLQKVTQAIPFSVGSQQKDGFYHGVAPQSL